jgi:hypothetical protein
MDHFSPAQSGLEMVEEKQRLGRPGTAQASFEAVFSRLSDLAQRM